MVFWGLGWGGHKHFCHIFGGGGVEYVFPTGLGGGGSSKFLPTTRKCNRPPHLVINDSSLNHVCKKIWGYESKRNLEGADKGTCLKFVMLYMLKTHISLSEFNMCSMIQPYPGFTKEYKGGGGGVALDTWVGNSDWGYFFWTGWGTQTTRLGYSVSKSANI